MCNHSVKESPVARNRRLFLAALGAGIAVHPGQTPGLYWVDSKSSGGRHLVEVYTDGATRRELCHCDWGKREGWIVTEGLGSGHATKTGRPCCHTLLTRWHLLDADARAAVCEIDPDIDAAVVVAAAARLVAPALVPVVARPVVRRERSQEAW